MNDVKSRGCGSKSQHNAFEFQRPRARQASKIFKRPSLHIAPSLHALPLHLLNPFGAEALHPKRNESNVEQLLREWDSLKRG